MENCYSIGIKLQLHTKKIYSRDLPYVIVPIVSQQYWIMQLKCVKRVDFLFSVLITMIKKKQAWLHDVEILTALAL